MYSRASSPFVQTFYRWRKVYGGLKMGQAKRLKELEKENRKLERLVVELSLDKQIPKDIAEFLQSRKQSPRARDNSYSHEL